MKLYSEKGLNKSIKLYELMIGELSSGISSFNDIEASVELLMNNMDALEGRSSIYTISRMLNEYHQNIEFLYGLRNSFSKDLENAKKNLEEGNFTGEKTSIEELESLKKSTEVFIEVYGDTIKSIQPLKKEIDKVRSATKCDIRNDESPYTNRYELKSNVYTSSGDAQIKIEQIADIIQKNIKGGNIHAIVMEDSLMAADIELLSKKNKR